MVHEYEYLDTDTRNESNVKKYAEYVLGTIYVGKLNTYGKKIRVD